MAETAVVPRLAKAAKSYVRDVADLIASGSTTEATYYPAVRSLIVAALSAEDLPFDVRINTSEQKTGGGVNLPDIALYDADGEFLVVCGEVKLPAVELEQLAISTENQGSNRALSRGDTGRSDMQRAGIRARDLSPKWKGDGPVPPEARRIEQVVELWPSVSALKQRKAIEIRALESYAELIETARLHGLRPLPSRSRSRASWRGKLSVRKETCRRNSPTPCRAYSTTSGRR